MRILNVFAFFTLLTIPLTSCKEESSISIISNVRLVGKWQLYKYKDSGYLSNPYWQTITDEERSYLEFHPDGNFIQTHSVASGTKPCVGKYEVLTENEILMDIDCQAYPVIWDVIISQNILIIIFHGREGDIFYKYTKVE